MRARGWTFRLLLVVGLGAIAFLAGGPFAGGGVVTSTDLPLGEPLGAYNAPNRFPKAGNDAFGSIASFDIFAADQGSPNDPCHTPPNPPEQIEAAGDVLVQRSAVGDFDRDGRPDIQTEMVSMSLTGFSPNFGNVHVGENPLPSFHSLGSVESKSKSDLRNFPADSFFDIFVELSVDRPAPMTLMNNEQNAIQLRATVLGLPPIGSDYRGQNTVPLFDQANPTGPTVACLAHASHSPEEPSHVQLMQELIRIQKQTTPP